LQETAPYFGDDPLEVEEDCFRLACGNIHNITAQPQEAACEELCRSIANLGLDVVLLQEMGVNWSVMGYTDQFQQRMNEWFEKGQTCSYASHNTHDLTGNKNLWGGTGIFTQGKLKYYAMGAGSDKAKLGRWTWARFVSSCEHLSALRK